jgi:hypothetical protein
MKCPVSFALMALLSLAACQKSYVADIEILRNDTQAALDQLASLYTEGMKSSFATSLRS